MKTKRILAVLAVATASAALASATTLNCAGVADVASDGSSGLGTTSGNNCNVTGAASILFSNFSDSFTGGASGAVGISSLTSLTNVSGNSVNLGLQFPSPTGGNGDILLFYTVTGGISGIDLQVQAAPLTLGGSITVTETACGVAFSAGTCSDVLGQITGSTSGTTIMNLSQTFSTTGTVFIKKDIGFANANDSEFQNSQLTGVPEPMTLSLVGAGLLGIGLIGRKLRK
jgi:hypothetical protein